MRALHGVRLRALLSLHDVEFDLVSLFEALVAVQLDRAVMHEDIWTIFATNEPIALSVVEPLHFAFVWRHEPVTFLQSRVR
jgi:hypothetical protein